MKKKRAEARFLQARKDDDLVLLLFVGLVGRARARARSGALPRALALRVAVAALLIGALALVRLVGRAARTARALVALLGVGTLLRAAGRAAAGRVTTVVLAAVLLVVRAVALALGMALGIALALGIRVLVIARAGRCRAAALLLLRGARTLLRAVLVLRTRLLRVGGLVVLADGLAALVALADLRVRLHVRRDVGRHGGVTRLRIHADALRERELAEGSDHETGKGITENLTHKRLSPTVVPPEGVWAHSCKAHARRCVGFRRP